MIDENIEQIKGNQFLQDVDWNLVQDMNNVKKYQEHIHALKMTIDNHIQKQSQNLGKEMHEMRKSSVILFDELLG